MFRHVVDVMHKNGATNFVSVLNLMGSQKWADRPGQALYPGDSYVGWLAFAPTRVLLIGVQAGTVLDMMPGTAVRRRGAAIYDWAAGRTGQADHARRAGDQRVARGTTSSGALPLVGTSIVEYSALEGARDFNNHDAYRCVDIRTDTTPGSLTAVQVHRSRCVVQLTSAARSRVEPRRAVRSR